MGGMSLMIGLPAAFEDYHQNSRLSEFLSRIHVNIHASTAPSKVSKVDAVRSRLYVAVVHVFAHVCPGPKPGPGGIAQSDVPGKAPPEPQSRSNRAKR